MSKLELAKGKLTGVRYTCYADVCDISTGNLTEKLGGSFGNTVSEFCYVTVIL